MSEKNGTGGPATKQGKEVARWNAARHGMRSPAPVVPGIERVEDWERHLAGTLESLAPDGHLETVLAERVALLSWRLHRVTRYETEAISLSQERMEDDLRQASIFSLGDAPDSPGVARGKLQSAKEELRMLKRFLRLADHEKVSAFDADHVLLTVAEHTDAAQEVDPSEIIDGISIPGVPDEWEARETFDGWTAGLLRRALGVIVAEADSEGPEAVLRAARVGAEFKVKNAKDAAGKAERALTDMSRKRLLPSEQTLQKVARYEAHLSRLFHKALHELEAMQTRRQGGSAPLARLDVEGLPEG